MGDIKTLPFKYYLGALNVGWKGNSYSGSVSLNPARHNAADSEFKYRMFIEKDDDGNLLLRAQHYVGNKSFDNTDESVFESADFSADDDGVEKARLFLEDALKKAKESAGDD